MADCKNKQTEADCPAGSDHCGEISMEYSGTKVYSKGCVSKATCDNFDVHLKACSAGTCTLDCCEGDLCNGDTVPMVSVLLMVTCALIALFR